MGLRNLFCLPFQPVVTSQLGTINNLIHVKKSDFEVFDALQLDSMESAETSYRGDWVVFTRSWCVFLIMHVCFSFSEESSEFYLHMFLL